MNTETYWNIPSTRRAQRNSRYGKIAKWFIITDPGEYTDLITEHDKDLERSEPRYEGRVIGTELRKWLEEYEELRMDARKMEVYEFKPLNDLLIDEEFGEELVEGEDAAVIQ